MAQILTEFGPSQRWGFVMPNANQVIRCSYQNCGVLINSNGLQKSRAVHFRQCHRQVARHLMITTKRPDSFRTTSYFVPGRPVPKTANLTREHINVQPAPEHQQIRRTPERVTDAPRGTPGETNPGSATDLEFDGYPSAQEEDPRETPGAPKHPTQDEEPRTQGSPDIASLTTAPTPARDGTSPKHSNLTTGPGAHVQESEIQNLRPVHVKHRST